MKRMDSMGSKNTDGETLPAESSPLLRGIRGLSDRDIMQRVVQADNPRQAVRALSAEDFYWVVKKVGEQDALILLELASDRQWQYVLDLELWDGDRLDLDESGAWLGRLEQTDCRRLARWLLGGAGSALAGYHLFRSVDIVVIEDEEELWNLPDGYFSVDGIYFVRAADPEQQPYLEHILRVMADEDYDRYQALLLGLAGVIPDELEEDMYRFRNVRLAEHGFLPPEEARAVYAPLDPAAVEQDAVPLLHEAVSEEGDAVAVPLVPLEHMGSGNMLTEAVASFRDPGTLDRVRLEFAGLCNQLLSADRTRSPDLETLMAVCRKASATVNLGLERLGGKDLEAAALMLEKHTLVSLFRVGFGLALKVKWEAQRWLNESWFFSRGLQPGFWGAYWGGVLAGIMEEKPRLFVGHREGEETRDFEWLSDLGECLKVIRRLMVLDGLLAKITEIYPLSPNLMSSPDLSFRPLLFNLWARRLLGLQPSFFPITQAQAGRFLETLRGGGGKGGTPRPRPRPGFGEEFVEDFMGFAPASDAEASSILKEALELIWQEFQEEYRGVPLDSLDPRYSKFFTIRPS